MESVSELIGSPASKAITSSATKKATELGQEDFLRLMVAQLEHQDPSKPMDNFEFLAQISQFSMVNGIQGLQKSFDKIGGALFAGQALQAVQLVGSDVVTNSGTALLGPDAPLRGVIDLPTYASGVQVRIQDGSGRLVQVQELGPSSAGRVAFSWDGVNGNGGVEPFGNYQVTAQAVINGQFEAVPAFAVARVESVALTGNGTQANLRLAGGQDITLADVREYL